MEGGAPAKKYIIGGNWKSNGTVSFVRDHVTNVLNTIKFDESKVEVIVAPLSIHIPSAKALLNKEIKVSSQNVSATKDGAFTGEVSAEQLTDFDLHWTLIGHSERRQHYGETDEIVAKKVTRAQEGGLSAIVCIGETLEQREGGQTADVVKAQLDAFIDSVTDWQRIVVAYEPIWAIGTGKTATPEIAQETHAVIRQHLVDKIKEPRAMALRIQYGGSVNDKNAKTLIEQPDIDGFLVGGASLKEAFKVIVEAANEHHGSQAQ
jgi:triosephosphate isomerase